MPTVLEINQILEIIRNSGIEDITILNESYTRILRDDELDSESMHRYVLLVDSTKARIKELI